MPEDPEDEQVSSARPFWSGTITFGLVSVPVEFYPATRPYRVSLRMLGPDGEPLRRAYYAPDNGRDLQEEQMVRGYELENGKYVTVTDEELERLAPEKTRDIDLRLFVDKDKIPPIYFERAYFLAPGGPSNKAYRLLAATMERTGKAGIASFVMRGREYIVAILSENGILRAEVMWFADEVRTPVEIGLPKGKKPDERVVKRFEKAIRARTKDDISLDEMHDQDAAAMLSVIEAKKKGNRDVIHVEGAEEEPEQGKVVDILELLKQSLNRGKAPAPEKRPPSRETARKASRDLAARSREDLYELAKTLNIPGRSAMSRQQLISAIKKAQAA